MRFCRWSFRNRRKPLESHRFCQILSDFLRGVFPDGLCVDTEDIHRLTLRMSIMETIRHVSRHLADTHYVYVHFTNHVTPQCSCSGWSFMHSQSTISCPDNLKLIRCFHSIRTSQSHFNEHCLGVGRIPSCDQIGVSFLAQTVDGPHPIDSMCSPSVRPALLYITTANHFEQIEPQPPVVRHTGNAFQNLGAKSGSSVPPASQRAYLMLAADTPLF
ncbi:hypothetical protein PYCCODRAFT_1228426 [Trametes coccinea BRFM310]|uniref:Uncharacterized protein n=1 Tax=Trametes coccinea (strain BRFM310) TaxID=1353009 RepID=A0A1Y2IXN4_TRAC3|nr:hypothetical protein PYCCODRAFT_1228426 [Trametes coccinea BRFM310]